MTRDGILFAGKHVSNLTTKKKIELMPEKKMNRLKNPKQYEALVNKGMSNEKAARIANTENPDYNSTAYEDRTKKELLVKAKEVGIKGLSQMNKNALIEALRNH